MQQPAYPTLWFLLLLAACAVYPAASPDEARDKTAVLWHPYVEWEVDNPNYTDNPYDVIARVRFEHVTTGSVHTTEMFYDGQNTWKWRFTGTQTGRWTFTSRSSDADLNGLRGTVEVEPNPDPSAHGFVTNLGSTWARRVGNNRETVAFVPQLIMYREADALGPAYVTEEDIHVFLNEHGFNGFHIPSIGGRWFDHDAGPEVTDAMDNPDPETFEKLEAFITEVHQAGGTVHLWAWGDEARGWTPTELAGGINGLEDRRLQRYIAARLGPLPGWTMGYGFDLWEWVDGEALTAWRYSMHAYLGWPHLLGARSEKNRLTQLSEAMDYASYEQHRPDYETYVQTIEQRPDKPSFSEDRFRIRESPYPEKDYDMTRVRRGLWHSTMAGGVANIWGHLHNSPESGGSGPFPRPEWIKTYDRFFNEHRRFRTGLRRANELSPDADTRILKLPGDSAYLLYREHTATVKIDLSAMDRPQPAVAVDTKARYEEIDLGQLQPGVQQLTLPYDSDWAIAVGPFE